MSRRRPPAYASLQELADIMVGLLERAYASGQIRPERLAEPPG